MTQFRANDETFLKTEDPFKNAPDCRPYYQVSMPVKEDKYPKGRAIAAAFWISYFVLHWLTILEVVESTSSIAGTTIYFILFAVIATVLVVASEDMSKKKDGD